ncbi:hypothetical protein BFG57_02240 [Bacillus solimangrovi]|uniref:SCP domain-containing protein n=2 Tax=Bacillus solimangrovi TaxID=1305675 RepID=A0A1E5LFN5_9BACI|nr:hypothetical protein BFG57_02240 [Bacillus solimangrovi]
MIDTSAKVKRGRTFIPLRSATESFGYDVIWKENENAVYLKSNPTIKPKDSTQQYVMEGDFFKLKEIEKEIFFLTNKERVKQGLKPFILDVNVSKVAQIKSADMYNKSYFDHTSPTYGSPFEMMKQFNIEYIAAGENIAAGYSSAVEVTNGWMKSQGHRENILNEDFTRIGIGYYEADNNYRTYYTQLFSKQQRDVK